MADISKAKALLVCADRNLYNAIAKDINPKIYTMAFSRNLSEKNKLTTLILTVPYLTYQTFLLTPYRKDPLLQPCSTNS